MNRDFETMKAAALAMLAAGECTPSQAAALCGVSQQAADRWCKALGIDWRLRSEKRLIRQHRRRMGDAKRALAEELPAALPIGPDGPRTYDRKRALRRGAARALAELDARERATGADALQGPEPALRPVRA